MRRNRSQSKDTYNDPDDNAENHSCDFRVPFRLRSEVKTREH